VSGGASAFRGTIQASGFVLETSLLGEAEVRRRVVDLWRSRLTVRRMPDGAWLVVLADPVEVRSERAPGLPLVAVDGALTAPGLLGITTEPGCAVLPRAGRVLRLRLADLPTVDQAGWVDLTGLRTELLTPLDLPADPPVTLGPTSRPPAPDLRAAAGVRRRTPAGDRRARKLTRTRGLARGGPPRSPRQGRGLIARLVLRSPAAAVVGRRHTRYLKALTEKFERRRWDEALRDAIALGGAGGVLSLRLPVRRTASLRPTAWPRASGRSVPYGPTVQQHLADLYRQAATELERAGRVEEAAFVLADLLDAATEAVALLERGKRWELAAELAEGRQLTPELVVRLWWRAGQRDRAIEIARARGAFASAVERLSSVDAAAARELREAWVRGCQSAGDHLAAVEAAWPDERLRPLVIQNLEAGMALGGPAAAALFAHLVTDRPSDAARTGALALLDSREADDRPARERFVIALAGLRSRDLPQDRELCTAALRMLVRDAGTLGSLDERTARRTLRALRERADPLITTDLPSLGWQARSPRATLEVTAPAHPGQLPVFDAAVLAGGAVLVAGGDFGVRLLTPDGRVRARWDVPAHQLIVADHGGSVLLAAWRGAIGEVHRLDLASRRVRRWATLHVRQMLPSFDGGLLTVIDDDGIALLDALADRPRVVWRELGRDTTVHQIGRSPTSLAALVSQPVDWPRGARFELWRWDLPGMTLRQRPHARVDGALGAAILTTGRLLTLHPDPAGDSLLLRWHDGRRVLAERALPHDPATAILTSGDVHAVLVPSDDGIVAEIAADLTGAPAVRAVFPAADSIGMRLHARIVTIWDRRGRLVAADLDGPRLRTSLRTRI
jgi:hypothetical protein